MKNFTILFIILGIITLTDVSAAFKNCYQTCNISTSEIKAAEEKAYDLINRIRRKHGRRPLQYWTQLSNCAREHSQNMASGKTPFGHQGFDERAKKMQSQACLCAFGENVAYSYNCADPVETAVDGWMKSPSHRDNILGDFEETGIGIGISKEGKFYATQLFATRAKSNCSYTKSVRKKRCCSQY